VRVVLDTNVLMSGIFFGGAPAKVLDAWRDGAVELVISPSIKREYSRVAEELTAAYGAVDVERILELITLRSETVTPRPLPQQVCTDPDDDMFIAAAIAGKADVIVSGDKALRKVSCYQGINILNPAEFVRLLENE